MKLIAKCRHLARLPVRMGRPRPELLLDLRSTPYGNYMIFFRYVGDTFEVVNILEGHLDIDAHFEKKK
jgi:plasmid stabilization system protein ParE